MSCSDITYHRLMGRWAPGTRERLQQVALELFRRDGYDATTVADIAGAAEVTERTFYRYFTDKREVLFDGQDQLGAAFVDGVAGAPTGATPMEIAAAGLDHAGAFFTAERRAWSRGRQAVIESDPALRERELLKLAALADRLADALRDRGITDPQARLCADAALSVFRTTFARWLADGEGRSFGDLQRETLSTLQSLSAPNQT
ncbi:TetR family transcriptional regulator [Microlunatus ginsengisoli]|uniref:TetR family transcriptional regulator n=2 Tax=Microlunatus ginsengisoli TaxID=363863 RepID=A0ABP7A825_9ACTN